jgi:hypothetical protein
MKREAPIQFANALTRAGKDFDFVPLRRQNDDRRDPAARLHANSRFPWFCEKNL